MELSRLTDELEIIVVSGIPRLPSILRNSRDVKFQRLK